MSGSRGLSWPPNSGGRLRVRDCAGSAIKVLPYRLYGRQNESSRFITPAVAGVLTEKVGFWARTIYSTPVDRVSNFPRSARLCSRRWARMEFVSEKSASPMKVKGPNPSVNPADFDSPEDDIAASNWRTEQSVWGGDEPSGASAPSRSSSARTFRRRTRSAGKQRGSRGSLPPRPRYRYRSRNPRTSGNTR